jgi:anti-anti-sigma factor
MAPEENAAEIVLMRVSDYGDISGLVSRIDDLIEAGFVRIVFDLDTVAVVNSTLLGFFVKTTKVLEARGGGVALVRLTEFVSKTIDMLGLETVLTISPDVDGALARLEK